MKSVQSKVLLFLTCCVFFFPCLSYAVNLPWSTTFNYPECSQRGADSSLPKDCAVLQNDDIRWSWGSNGVGGRYTQVNANANYPGGAGGNGFRSWVGDGTNKLSGPVRVIFNEPQKELWIRWYMRYQEGFQWKNHSVHYNKTLYIRDAYSETSTASVVIPSLMTGSFSIHPGNTGVSNGVYGFSGAGWNNTYGPGVSDGSWNCFEIYIKMDTQSSPYNGVARMWLNGRLMGEYKNANFSNGNGERRKGWIWFDFNNNQNEVDNKNGPIGQSVAYVDYDDMVVYNSTPPSFDSNGNPFIGPATGGSVPHELAPPDNLRVLDSGGVHD